MTDDNQSVTHRGDRWWSMDRDDDDCGVLDNLDISNNGKQNIFLKVSRVYQRMKRNKYWLSWLRWCFQMSMREKNKILSNELKVEKVFWLQRRCQVVANWEQWGGSGQRSRRGRGLWWGWWWWSKWWRWWWWFLSRYQIFFSVTIFQRGKNGHLNYCGMFQISCSPPLSMPQTQWEWRPKFTRYWGASRFLLLNGTLLLTRQS